LEGLFVLLSGSNVTLKSFKAKNRINIFEQINRRYYLINLASFLDEPAALVMISIEENIDIYISKKNFKFFFP
jgi:hypothetical protein